MPKPFDLPDALRVFVAHGVELTRAGSTNQASGECPFCGKEGKFFVGLEDKDEKHFAGGWECKVCGANGNPATFLRKFWEEVCTLDSEQAETLREHRNLLDVATLEAWGVKVNPLTLEYVVPAYGAGGKLDQLYRYVNLPSSNRHVLIATPGFGHGLFGMSVFDEKKTRVDVYEGPWDAMAAWECLRAVKETTEGLEETGSESSSLLGEINVLAVPGANVIDERWIPLFKDKHVRTFYDNDHPRPHPKTGVMVDGAALYGTRRICQTLALDSDAPATIHYLNWGKDTFHDPELADGYDIRDHLSQFDNFPERAGNWSSLVANFMRPLSVGWVAGREPNAVKQGGTKLQYLDCREYHTLSLDLQHAFKVTEGLDRGLSVCLASITSTETVGDQLWVKIIGPPACGKSELAEALATNKEWVVAVSKLKGFHSGFQVDKGGKTDVSLIARLRNKTMITKDGDTLMKSDNAKEVMAEARDIYDRNASASYRTGMTRRYEGLNMTWILCGTESLRALDRSELGERFIDCVIMEQIDKELEMEIMQRKVFQAFHDLKIKADGKLESRASPEIVTFRRRTAGYIKYLRENAQSLVDALEFPTDDTASIICSLALFVSYCRCRPSDVQEEKSQREMATRLSSQLMRLACCLAVVLNRLGPNDPEVLRRTRRCALDTARGRTLDIASALHAAGPDGMDLTEIAMKTLRPEDKEKYYLQFLRNKEVGVVQTFRKSSQIHKGLRQPVRWRLHPEFASIYSLVMDGV